MSRINTNITSLIAQRTLGQQQGNLTKTLERLSTGYQINRGADNPAGLIASERLRSELAASTAAVGNAERADQVMNIAEGGLQEINSMLIQIQDLVGQSANEAGLSREEKEANQLQIDSILQTIDRISQTTSFEGTKLLNGTFDFKTTGQSNVVTDFQINAAKLNAGDTRQVQVAVTASAQHGALFVSAGGGTAINLANASSTFVFELTGSKGSRAFSFSSGTTLTAIASQINTFKDVLGVSAVGSGNYLELKSTTFGSSEFVKFKVVDDGGMTGGAVYVASAPNENAVQTATGATTFANVGDGVEDEGQDLGATINGIKATGKGNNANVSTDFIDLSVTLSANGAQTLGSFNAFTITGGGANFNLGPSVDIINKVSIGISNVTTRKLGNSTDGYLNDLAQGGTANVVDGDLATAQKIVATTIDQISSLRGRIGAFQKNVVGATIRSLGVAIENTRAAESTIRDTDFASQIAELSRNQVLVQAASSMLGISNAQGQNVLQLLG
ncbi:MAG: flagellin [Phycisphaeraceae bacterium]|nr:flagellin [Phycisphaeraceae bacterium]